MGRSGRGRGEARRMECGAADGSRVAPRPHGVPARRASTPRIGDRAPRGEDSGGGKPEGGEPGGRTRLARSRAQGSGGGTSEARDLDGGAAGRGRPAPRHGPVSARRARAARGRNGRAGEADARRGEPSTGAEHGAPEAGGGGPTGGGQARIVSRAVLLGGCVTDGREGNLGCFCDRRAAADGFPPADWRRRGGAARGGGAGAGCVLGGRAPTSGPAGEGGGSPRGGTLRGGARG